MDRVVSHRPEASRGLGGLLVHFGVWTVLGIVLFAAGPLGLRALFLPFAPFFAAAQTFLHFDDVWIWLGWAPVTLLVGALVLVVRTRSLGARIFAHVAIVGYWMSALLVAGVGV